MRGFWEERFQAGDAQTRARWFDEAAGANASIVQIRVGWKDVVGESPPVDPRNPADPTYDLEGIDSSVRDAVARDLTVLITVEDAPAWAELGTRPDWAKPGTWRPDPSAFGAFGEALARRYSGSFAPDPSGGPLPRVGYFEVWNEPNQNDFLAPQWRRREPFAPHHLRRMLNAFYEGLKNAGSGAKVVGPGTSPYGDSSRHGSRMRPLLFLRELLCLKGRRKLKPTRCRNPAGLDIVSHHPINLFAGPNSSAEHPDDATVPDMKHVRRTVRAAERAGNVRPAGRRQLWVTEIWWLTDPPHSKGFPPRTQARWLQQALYLLWRQRVRAVIWYQVTDEGGFPSGLFFSSGNPKPGLTAFRFPFVPDRQSRRRTVAWGIAPETGDLSIQRRTEGRWRTIEKIRVVAGRPFREVLRLRGAATLRASQAGTSPSLAGRVKRERR